MALNALRRKIAIHTTRSRSASYAASSWKARLNCMPPRASLKGRISTWLRIIGLQFRAMPGANQAPEPIQRRFKAPKIARKTRSTCQSLTTFWANPLQYLLCSVETRRAVEVYLKQYRAFSCCRKSVSALERRSQCRPEWSQSSSWH